MNDYRDLERSDRASRRIVDHTGKWNRLDPVASVNGQTAERLRVFCESKRITVDALAALAARIKILKGGAVALAYAGTNGNGQVTAIKYRPLGGSSHDSTAEAPSTWLRPIVVGNLGSLDWIIAEGETDAARLWGLVGDRAAILALPAGARTFRREWAQLIPRGATVALAHDADPDGDAGAKKAATIIGGRTIRLRPPVDGGDWCSWDGDRQAFLELLATCVATVAGKLTATPLTEITMRSIRWREKPIWQHSAFQLLAGAKGSGKGTYLAGLAARVSQDDGNVLIVSSEDSAEIDLKPRLVAAGANLDRCYLIQQHVKLPDDVDALRTLAAQVGGADLLVIDPVANHIGDQNSNSDAEVRHAIGPLNGLADELDCLLIGVRHPGKDRSRGALASILGSTAWVDTPRAVVMIAVDDQDDLVRHIQVVAGNRALNGAGHMFRIDAVPVDGLDEPITLATMLGESSKNVDDLLAHKPADEAVPSHDLQTAILEALETGAKGRDFLDAVGADLGATKNIVYERGLVPLRDQGRIRATKDGMNGKWSWQLT